MEGMDEERKLLLGHIWGIIKILSVAVAYLLFFVLIIVGSILVAKGNKQDDDDLKTAGVILIALWAVLSVMGFLCVIFRKRWVGSQLVLFLSVNFDHIIVSRFINASFQQEVEKEDAEVEGVEDLSKGRELTWSLISAIWHQHHLEGNEGTGSSLHPPDRQKDCHDGAAGHEKCLVTISHGWVLNEPG